MHAYRKQSLSCGTMIDDACIWGSAALELQVRAWGLRGSHSILGLVSQAAILRGNFSSPPVTDHPSCSHTISFLK